MADETTVPASATNTETAADASKIIARRRSSADKPAASSSDRTPDLPRQTDVALKRRRYSDAEKVEKVASIEDDTGKWLTLRAAAKNAGITEQSYYQWKKAATAPPRSSQPIGEITYSALLELEAENQLLRAQLANTLRAENEDLRNRLRDT